MKTALVALLALLYVPAVRAQTAPQTNAHAQEAFVFEQVRNVRRYEKDGTGRRETHVRVRTQSDAGVQQWGQLVFDYSAANERPEIAYIRVRKPDGSVVTTATDAIQDLSAPVQRVAPIYTDFRQKHATVEGLRPGDTLEYSIATTVHTALAPGQFWTEYEFTTSAIVLDEQLEIDVPAERKVTLKVKPGYEAKTEEKAGRRIYRWTRSNLTRPDEDDETKAKTTKDADEAPAAAVRLTTFENWEQVGGWYAALEATQRTPSPEIRKKAAELIAGRTSSLDKLEALYEYVATNFRYVSLSLGMGRYQPRAAPEVLREQYGDCKDKHTLLASLIEAAGLRASAVLIHSASKIDPAFPSPSQFDHVITKIADPDGAVWVDSTSEVAPFRLLPLALRNKQALVVEAGGTPRLESTPANPPMKSFMLMDVRGELGETGSLRAHIQASFRGDVELLMRTVFRMTPAASWKTVLEKFFATAPDGKAEVTNWKVSEPAALKDPFRIELDLALDRFVPWSSGKASIPLPFTGPATAATGAPDGDGPIVLGAAPTEMSYKLILSAPPAITFRAPLPVSVVRDYAEYRASYKVDGGTLSAERVFLVRESEVPGDRTDDYAAFTRVVAADSGQRLTLQTSSTAAANVSADLKANELNRRGYAAFEARNYADAVSLLKRAVELEPKDKTAWNNLGRAYMGLRQFESAIEAFRKQIEVNPYDAYAYNNLAESHIALQKFDEAETALKKQLELNPIDRYATLRLGGLYVERRQYEAALPHLEKGVTLAPDDSWLHLQLGKAHLNLKHEADAMSAFDRAVDLSPTPLTWNNIAYELGLKRVQLDRALQYAESAVATATAASRTLDVSRADDNAMEVVRSLAAYWDTLGWVHFARGDATRAEPLVEAAWRLAQHAEVGDHLAQIYEKAGRRDDAIKTYAMALAAPHPSADVRDRLAKLVGKSDIDRLVNQHRGELSAVRTVTVPATGTRGKTAEFLVLFSAAGAESVRFVEGDETLRPLANDIQKASFGRMFPDDAPAKLLRRGALACPSTAGPCAFTLMLPDDAQAVK